MSGKYNDDEDMDKTERTKKKTTLFLNFYSWNRLWISSVLKQILPETARLRNFYKVFSTTGPMIHFDRSHVRVLFLTLKMAQPKMVRPSTGQFDSQGLKSNIFGLFRGLLVLCSAGSGMCSHLCISVFSYIFASLCLPFYIFCVYRSC